MNKTITEYGFIYTQEKKPSFFNSSFEHTLVTKEQFKELYSLWQKDDNLKKVLEFDGYNFKAKNYVGVIQTQNLSLEILPKTYSGANEQKNRTIFIEMLKPLLGMNALQLNKANLSTTKEKNIFEIFIALFVESLENLLHKGLKSSYVQKEQNQPFLKGKLKLTQHLKQNFTHKERFYVEFDDYLPNRVENKLLKSTIQLLLSKTKSIHNKKLLRQYYFYFDEVSLSHNYKKDIEKINLHRGMQHYTIPLQFAKVFLLHNSFTPLRGSKDVFALLFPMQKVFESYVEFLLNNSKQNLNIKKVVVNGYKDEYFLTQKQARLEPDYLLKMKDNSFIVTDAKWKLYDDAQTLSSSDVYQLFAYLSFYECSNIAYLFVPKVQNQEDKEYNYQTKKGFLTYKIKIIPLDLEEIINNNHKIKSFIK